MIRGLSPIPRGGGKPGVSAPRSVLSSLTLPSGTSRGTPTGRRGGCITTLGALCLFEEICTAGAQAIVYILASLRRAKLAKEPATNHICVTVAPSQKRRRGGRRGRGCGREIFEGVGTAGAKVIVYILPSHRRAKLAKGSVRSLHPAHRRAAQKKRSALRRPSLPLSNLLILS